MFKIPDEFRDTPEAARVREATARFEAAIEQQKRIAQQSGERVHLVTGQLRQAQEELSESTECFRCRHGRAKAGRADLPWSRKSLSIFPRPSSSKSESYWTATVDARYLFVVRRLRSSWSGRHWRCYGSAKEISPSLAGGSSLQILTSAMSCTLGFR